MKPERPPMQSSWQPAAAADSCELEDSCPNLAALQLSGTAPSANCQLLIRHFDTQLGCNECKKRQEKCQMCDETHCSITWLGAVMPG